MDIDQKTTIARELLGLAGCHDTRTLFDALQPILQAGARDGLGNAVADMYDRCEALTAWPSLPSVAVSLAHADPVPYSHHAVVVWLTAERVDLREVADIIAGAQERHVWQEAVRLLGLWVEEQS